MRLLRTNQIRVKGDAGVVLAAVVLDLRLRRLGHVGGPRLLELLLAFLVGGLDGELGREDVAELGAVTVAAASHLRSKHSRFEIAQCMFIKNADRDLQQLLGFEMRMK